MIRIGTTSDLPPGEAKYVIAEGTALALVNVEGTFYAVDNDCPHQGAPLGDGFLDGYLITCPLHAWQFDVRTGEMPDHPKFCVKTYPVTVVDGELFVEL